jgi:hypothetical protein
MISLFAINMPDGPRRWQDRGVFLLLRLGGPVSRNGQTPQND